MYHQQRILKRTRPSELPPPTSIASVTLGASPRALESSLDRSLGAAASIGAADAGGGLRPVASPLSMGGLLAVRGGGGTATDGLGGGGGSTTAGGVLMFVGEVGGGGGWAMTTDIDGTVGGDGTASSPRARGSGCIPPCLGSSACAQRTSPARPWGWASAHRAHRGERREAAAAASAGAT